MGVEFRLVVTGSLLTEFLRYLVLPVAPESLPLSVALISESAQLCCLEIGGFKGLRLRLGAFFSISVGFLRLLRGGMGGGWGLGFRGFEGGEE